MQTTINRGQTMQDSYLSIREIASLLKVNYQVVRTLIIGGHIKAIKVGRQWRVKQSEFDHFIDKRTTSLINH